MAMVSSRRLFSDSVVVRNPTGFDEEDRDGFVALTTDGVASLRMDDRPAIGDLRNVSLNGGASENNTRESVRVFLKELYSVASVTALTPRRAAQVCPIQGVRREEA
jgi:hypothetical protein